MKRCSFLSIALIVLIVATTMLFADNREFEYNKSQEVSDTGRIRTPIPAGTYIVNLDEEIGDYNTLREAVEDLNERGIDGPVIFDINPGFYDDDGEELDPITIYEIEGAGAESWVTFTNTDLSGHAVIFGNTPYWYWGEPTRPDIEANVYLIGAKYIRFENLAFRRYTGFAEAHIGITGGSEHIEITSCIFNFETTGGIRGIQTYASHNILITNNAFNITNGVTINGIPSDYSRGIEIRNNKFEVRGHAFSLNYVDAFIFSGNSVEAYHTDYYNSGGSLGHTRGAFRFESNRIFDTDQYGIVWGGYVAFIGYSGGHIDDGETAIFANNMIGGGFRTQSNWVAGIRIFPQIHNVAFYYNSINVDLPGNYSAACINFRQAQLGSTNLRFVNNSLAYTGGGGGRAFAIDPHSVIEMDYNNYYSNGAILATYGDDHYNLAAIQGVDNRNLNSRVGDPQYISSMDLHSLGAQLWRAGTPIEGIDFDIDGDPRDPVNPCIGADEYEAEMTHDLEAVSLDGPETGKVGEIVEFEFTVTNTGSQWQTEYELRLMREGDIMLASVWITEAIWSGDEETHVIQWTPNNTGFFNIYGRILLEGDENPFNDRTEMISILIEQGDTNAEDVTIPVLETALRGNYPNPFNPETAISYSLKENVSDLSLRIFNLRGQLVRTLLNSEAKEKGEHQIVWDGTDNQGRAVNSGLYFYRMNTGDFQSIRRMMLLK